MCLYFCCRLATTADFTDGAFDTNSDASVSGQSRPTSDASVFTDAGAFVKCFPIGVVSDASLIAAASDATG